MKELQYTYFEVNYINFNHNDGDYIICENIEQVSTILKEVEHILDSSPDESNKPYSVEIKPKVMTKEQFATWSWDYTHD